MIPEIAEGIEGTAEKAGEAIDLGKEKAAEEAAQTPKINDEGTEDVSEETDAQESAPPISKEESRRKRLSELLAKHKNDLKKATEELIAEEEAEEAAQKLEETETPEVQKVDSETPITDILEKNEKPEGVANNTEIVKQLTTINTTLSHIEQIEMATFELHKENQSELNEAIEKLFINQKSEELGPHGGNNSPIVSQTDSKKGDIASWLIPAGIMLATIIADEFKQIENFVEKDIIAPAKKAYEWVEKMIGKIESFGDRIARWLGISDDPKDLTSYTGLDVNKQAQMEKDFEKDPLTKSLNQSIIEDTGIGGDYYRLHIDEDIVKEHEGLKLKAYPDGSSYAIGYGHNLKSDMKFGFLQIGDEKIPMKTVMSKGLTKEQAEQLYKQDVFKREQDLEYQLGDSYRKLNENQKESLMDYYFNTGHIPNNLKEAIESGDMKKAASVLETTYTHGKQGSKIIDLQPRREEEAKLFLQPPSTEKVTKLAENSDSKPIINLRLPEPKTQQIHAPAMNNPGPMIDLSKVPSPSAESSAYDYSQHWDLGWNPSM